MDCNSPYDKENERAVAEDELRALGGCVLNLAGLYGGERQVCSFQPQIATSRSLEAATPCMSPTSADKLVDRLASGC